MTIGSSLSLKVAIESPYLWMNWFIDGWPSDITSEANVSKTMSAELPRLPTKVWMPFYHHASVRESEAARRQGCVGAPAEYA